VFSNNQISENYWENEIVPSLTQKYTGDWLIQELNPRILSLEKYSILFFRFSYLIGLKITKGYKSRIFQSQKNGMDFPLFDMIDISHFEAIVKTTITSTFANANYFLMKSKILLKSDTEDRTQMNHYKELAIKLLKRCLVTNPLNGEVLYLIADAMAAIQPTSDKEIDRYYKRALEASPKDPQGWFKYALCLRKRLKGCKVTPLQKFEIENLFLMALEINPVDPKVLVEYSKFLWVSCKEFDSANQFFVGALKFSGSDQLGTIEEVYSKFLKELNNIKLINTNK